VASLVEVCAISPVQTHSIISPEVMVILAGLKTKSSTLTVCVVELPVFAERFDNSQGMTQLVVVKEVLAVQVASSISVTTML